MLGFLELRKTKIKSRRSSNDYEAIIFGYRRAGPEFAHTFREEKIKFLVVDYNPDTIHKLEKAKVPCEYGDSSDVEFLNELPLDKLKFAVSTVPEFETNLLLTQVVRRANPEAIIIIITDTMEHAVELYDAGATNVVLSYYIGARHAADLISMYGFNTKKFEKLREEHLEYLHNIKDLNFQI